MKFVRTRWQQLLSLVVGMVCAAIGVLLLFQTHAATVALSVEPEKGTIVAPATSVSDSSASSGGAIVFHASTQASAGQGIAIPGTQLMFESQAALDADMQRVATAGAKWIRFDFAAVQMEATQGVTNFSNADRVVASAQSHGLKVLGILTTLPEWVNNNTWQMGPTTDAQRQAYVAFAGRTVMHFKGKVSYWEIWNEPNLDQFWSPKPSTVDYIKLIQGVYPVIKQVEPDATVLTGGTGGAGSAPDISTITWYQNLYNGGAKGYFDAVATHPYHNIGSFPAGELANAVQIRKIMDANGNATMKLWGTETGAPTGGSSSVTPAEQATLVGETYDYWLKNIHDPGPLFWYQLEDKGVTGTSTDREQYFGIMLKDGTPKPAYSAYQTWMWAHP